MQITFTRIAVPFVGIAFGFFIGCSTLSSSQDQIQPDELTEKEIKAELTSVNKKLEDSQENADLYYHKGYLLSEYAQKLEEPSERTSTYKELQAALNKAENLFSEANLPSGRQKVDELLKVTWSGEHNMGVQIMQSDKTLEGNDFDKAATHFQNATVILPDTSISYKMEAQAHYKNGKPMQALTALEQAKQNIDELPPEMLEQMAFLYLETDQPQKAVAVYEEAESFSANNLNVLHGLANAYISAGEHEKAVRLLSDLVKNEPDNIIYGRALATEYYHLGSNTLSKASNSDTTNSEEDKLLAKADSLFDNARQQFERLRSGNPENQELQIASAQFYQNTAAKYQKLLPEVSEDQKDDIEESIRSYLNTSISIYEKLVRQNPDSKTYWKNLYKAYSYLGMSDKAEEAKSKFN